MTKKEIFDIAVEIERLTADPYSFCDKFLNVDGNRRQKSIEQWQFNIMVSTVRGSWDFKEFKDNEYYRKMRKAFRTKKDIPDSCRYCPDSQ